MKELPQVWFFAVGKDRIIRSKARPKPFIRVSLLPKWIEESPVLFGALCGDKFKVVPFRTDDEVEYRLVETNECDRVAVYR